MTALDVTLGQSLAVAEAIILSEVKKDDGMVQLHSVDLVPRTVIWGSDDILGGLHSTAWNAAAEQRVQAGEPCTPSTYNLIIVMKNYICGALSTCTARVGLQTSDRSCERAHS